MRKLIDLSQPIENKGHARPFHPTPVVWTHLSHEESAPIWKKGGFSAMVKGVIVSDRSGSHTDAYTHIGHPAQRALINCRCTFSLPRPSASTVRTFRPGRSLP